MRKRIAVYAASLDPVTYGHINIIERASPLYNELVVLVAVDNRKNYTFTPRERLRMVESATKHLPNVKVAISIGRYIVKEAEDLGAQVIIRGLRNFKDMDDEQVLAEENRKISPGIETVWLPCLPHLMHVSSSMVKGHVGIDPGWEKEVGRSVPKLVVKNLKEKFLLGRARKHWDSLMNDLGNPIGSERFFNSLIASYSEPHRYYHNLEHILSMLDELEVFDSTHKRRTALKMAIWYHDKIYDPGSKNHPVIADNEERSAYQARKDLNEMGFDESFIAEVERLIICTNHKSRPEDVDALTIIDLDLMILGKSKVEFDAYEAGIRKEYKWVPNGTYAKKRIEVLESFLTRKKIYFFKFFQDKYEKTATKNLQKSIYVLLYR